MPISQPKSLSGFSNMTVFTASGTWTVPGGVTKAKITVVGGGGNGGNATITTTCIPQIRGGAGAGGGTAIGVFSVTGSYSVTVGGASQTTSVGALISATGGANGGNAVDGFGTDGSPGTGSGGSVNLPGQKVISASGGSSFYGWGAPWVTSAYSNGFAGTGYGSGGSGATVQNQGQSRTGGAGAPGIVIIEY